MAKTEHGNTTRQRILRAAVEVLVTKGFANLTIKDVAQATGIAFGNVTYHYPSKDALIDDMLTLLLDDYRQRFASLGAPLSLAESPVRQLVEWVIDDALTVHTARTFTELWAMSNHNPARAAQVQQLYDDAIESFIVALGVDPAMPQTGQLRSALYFFACISEGSSAIFGNRPAGHAERGPFRQQAIDVLVPLIEQALAHCRTDAKN